MLRITSVLKRNRRQDGVIITLHKTKFSQQKRQSQEDRQKVFLTLPDLSLLVPTMLSRGGGGGECWQTVLISQEPLNLEQRNFAQF